MIDAITGLDHVVINVRDQMDTTEATYRRLGFQLTPRGFHTLGTINHLMIFQDDYLELLGYPPGEVPKGLSPLIAGEPGLVACALASSDATAVYSEALAAGMPVAEPLDFSRPVDIPGGTHHAAFRVTRFDPDFSEGASLFVCEHHTRELVWRPEWQQHPNGTTGISFISVVVPDPAAAVGPYAAVFGDKDVTPMEGGLSLPMGRVRLELITAAALSARATGLERNDPPTAYMAILGLRVRDRVATAQYFHDQQLSSREDGERVQVSAAETGGVIVAFEE